MTSTATPVLPATLTLGAVHLTVADLDRAVAWYQRALGLRVHPTTATTAELGDGTRRRARPARGPAGAPAGRHAGLYHYALLYPTPRGARPRRGAPGRDAHADRGRLRPPHPRGDLPARRRRQRHRARRRPPARAVARRPRLRRRPRRRWTSTRCWRPSPARTPTPQVGPGLRMGHLHLHVGDIERGPAPSTATCSASRSRRNLGTAAFVVRRRLPPPPRLQRLARPGRRPRARAHRRPAPLDGAAAPRHDDRGPRRGGSTTPRTFDGGFLARDPWGTAVAFVS